MHIIMHTTLIPIRYVTNMGVVTWMKIAESDIMVAHCCDPFSYFTTPITAQSSVTYTANPKVGNWTILLHVCGSLQFICHHIDAYFSVPQNETNHTNNTRWRRGVKHLFKNTYNYSTAWFIWWHTIQKALLTENFEEHYISLFHLLRAPSSHVSSQF